MIFRLVMAALEATWLLATVFGSAENVPGTLNITNTCRTSAELYWLNPGLKHKSQYFLTLKGNGSTTHVNTFKNHQFEVKLTVNENEEKIVNYTKGMGDESIIISYDEKREELLLRTLKPRKTLSEHIKSAAKYCSYNRPNFTQCMTGEIAEEAMHLMDSHFKLKTYRTKLAEKLRNYTCADESMKSSTPVESVQVNVLGKPITIDIFLREEKAKLWRVNNFITEEECKVLETHGKPLLTRALVASQDGSAVVSESRKANQASYELHKEDLSDPLRGLADRLLAMVNHQTGYGLSIEGQEGFTIIQYNIGDEYTPHCDGGCDGSSHVDKGRVATAVLYCSVPRRGGATTFTNIDVFIKPEPGAATFFTYKGPDGRMDTGLTEHSGCPVIEGEKWITTLWMREGVTLEENHNKYDPRGQAILSE